MSKIKNGGLDQYGAEPFEQQQFGTAGVEGVKRFHKTWTDMIDIHGVPRGQCPGAMKCLLTPHPPQLLSDVKL